MILVAGATGTNGRVVVDRLIAKGQRVRALVRSKAKVGDLAQSGAELVEGDLDNPESLVKALSGVDRAFVVTAVHEKAVAWFANFFAAAQRAGVSHMVKFSGLGAGEANSVIHRQHGESDTMLKASGLAYTILRPNSFYQNMLMAAGTIKSMGKFFLPLGDAKQSCVDVRDIADVAVKSLTEKGHEGKVYDITGPQALSFHEVAAVLSKVLGKTVEYVPVPNEAAKQGMLQAGMPPWNAAAVAEIMSVFATGKYAFVTSTVEEVTSHKPITFEQFAIEHAGELR